MSINYPELLRNIAGELDERGQFGSSKICREAADFFERLNIENTDLSSENAALRAEVERWKPREMTVFQALNVLSDDTRYYYLRGHLTDEMVVYIAQGLERDAKGGG